MLLLCFTAAKPQSELVQNSFGFPKSLYMQNFIDVWYSEGLLHFLGNSLLVSGGVVFGTVLLSALAGYGMAQIHFPGKAILRVVLVLGLVVPVETLVIPLFYLMKQFGLLSTYYTMVLPQIGLGLPFGILLTHCFMLGLPPELFEAAEMDGCNSWKRFWWMAFPLLRPALVGVGIFQFI